MDTHKNGFLKRADAYIALANEQLSPQTTQGEVSASITYAASRFNSWMAASSMDSAWELKDAKEEIIEYFLKEYRLALEENLNDHIENFDFK